MEGFEKGFSPSRLSGSGENNENDSSQDNIMISMFQSHNKIVAKNFMSPTISAASKAIAPRKKILAERNQNSSNSDAKNQKISNPEMGASPRNSSVTYLSQSPSRIVPSSNHASDDDCDWATNVVAKSVKDYDPLTNYLSPRPRYLRFNPNRRREIFDRLVKKSRKESNSSLDSEDFADEGESLEEIKDSSFTPPRESFMNGKNEENTEEDYDYEEEEDELEEERGWCLRGVLKILLTLVACFLSTSYICSMNTRTPSPTQQAILNLKDGYLMVKKQALEVINMRMHDAGFLEVDVGHSYDEVEEMEINEDDNGEKEEIVEVEVGDSYGEFEEMEINEDDNKVKEEIVEVEVLEDNVEDLNGCDNVVGNEKEDSQDKVEDGVTEIEVLRSGELVFEADNFQHLVAPESNEIGSFSVQEEVESSYLSLNKDNVAKTDELEGLNQLEELEISAEYMLEEEKPQDAKMVDEMEPLELIESNEKLADSVPEVDKRGYDKELVGVSVVTVILTSLAIVYRSKKARNVYAQESKPQNEEKKAVTPELPPVKRKIEFFSRPSLSLAMEEASGELNRHIGAPHVELIGEVVVGQKSSKKHKMSESEKKTDATFSTPIQPSRLEYSTSSTSYGSFNTETKILKKEGGRSGEAMVEVTPLRRSSRLRNRAAAMSP